LVFIGQNTSNNSASEYKIKNVLKSDKIKNNNDKKNSKNIIHFQKRCDVMI